METDNQIRDFITNNYPETSDGELFMSELLEKLVIIEQAKTICYREQEFAKRWIVMAFIGGCILGVATILTVLFCPEGSMAPVIRLLGPVVSLIYQGRFFVFASIVSLTVLVICLQKQTKVS